MRHVTGGLLRGGGCASEFTSRGRVGMRVRIRVISGCLFAMRNVQEFDSCVRNSRAGSRMRESHSFSLDLKLFYIIWTQVRGFIYLTNYPVIGEFQFGND